MKMRYKFFKLFALYLLIPVILTACYDKIELEDRALVISMGIDRQDDEFLLSMEIPKELESKDEDNAENLKLAASSSVSSAMREIDSYSGPKLYYGHTKVCIIGNDVIKDPKLFKETIDALERNREISRKLIIMCSDSYANEIYSAKTDNNIPTGIFINDFYKNNIKSLSITFRQDLEGVIKQLLESSNTVLPIIKNEDEKLKISSIAVLKNYELEGFLNEEQSRGFLYLGNYPAGGEITIPFEDTNTALKITKKTSHIKLDKNDLGNYILNCTVDIEGNIEEYTLSENVFLNSDKYKILQDEYAENIKKEAQSAFELIQKKYKADVLGFGEMLRKNYYKDYLYMQEDTQKAFEQAKLDLDVKVKIKSAGSSR